MAGRDWPRGAGSGGWLILMARPVPTLLYHFTHVDHLASIAEHGLLSDDLASRRGLLTTEIGQPSIKSRRSERPVPCGAGGSVADYVPFYFAPRSPMLYAIQGGRVAEYQDGQDPLVYLVSSVERLVALGVAPVFTDRNGALALARFTNDLRELDDLIDWPLMTATMWANTSDEPDRRERRMAECLVHGQVPWVAFNEIGTMTQHRQEQAEAALEGVGHKVPVLSHPEWYF
ncbi:MAG: type II toxin-antitoxin system toxin DNA ADP-ribosyl transferase DarT [Acidimicrobiales bacterium]